MLIEKAKQLAHKAHDSIGQKRKYTEEPYWVHTDEVANMVASVTNDEEMIAAAHLHDILEDIFPINSFYSRDLINSEFNATVLNLVAELTDVFTHENYPQHNRETRKRLETERISKISLKAKTIKLADIISNAESIIKYDSGFARIFVSEIEKMLPFLQDGNPVLLKKVIKIVLDFNQKLQNIKS